MKTLMETTAVLLARGRQIERLSDGVTLIALLLGLLPSSAPHGYFALLVLLGLLQKYWALRVALDAGLFARLAQQADPVATQPLDESLTTLGLKPAAHDPRGWPPRCRAAVRLLRNQLLAFLAQALVALLCLFFIG